MFRRFTHLTPFSYAFLGFDQPDHTKDAKILSELKAADEKKTAWEKIKRMYSTE